MLLPCFHAPLLATRLLCRISVSAMPEVADEERALVRVRAGVGTVPGAGPEEDPGARQAGSGGRQVDMDGYFELVLALV